MKNISELLRNADPLRDEPIASADQRRVHRQAILAAASSTSLRAEEWTRSRIVVLATVALLVIVALFLGVRMGSPMLSEVNAAVRFEARLAEVNPAPGLRKAKISGSEQSVYLHDELIVTNSDIVAARLIQSGDPPHYSVGVEFTPSGTEKMRATTANHIGGIMAILLDGQVVMAPVLKSPIESSAVITGNFTKAQAKKIVNGITAQ